MTVQLSSQNICVSCGGAALQTLRRYRPKTKHGKAIFHAARLAQCEQCGLVQTVPSPTLAMLADYYAIDYRNGCVVGADVADVTQFPLDNLFYYNRGQSIADLVAPYIMGQAPRILDIGAGYGHILYALGERFPHSVRSAIEFSEVCVDHLRSIGITVYDQPAEEALPQMTEHFDLIILSHVLEHLLYPNAMLQLIHQRLAPGGILYIEVPHIPAESINHYLDSVWAPRFDEPHITFFSPQPLRRVLQSAGFDLLFCDTAGLPYRHITAWQFHMPHWRWFVQRITPPILFRFLRRQRFTQSLKVQSREESFYQYGGLRIWIRSISKRSDNKEKQ